MMGKTRVQNIEKGKKGRRPAGTEGFERQQPGKSFILVQTLRILKSILFPVIVAAIGTFFRFNEDKGNGGAPASTIELILGWAIPLAITILSLIVPLIIALIEYFHTCWFLTEKEIVLCRGAFLKRITRMPYEKIHAVNSTEKLLELITKTVTLTIDSAGGMMAGDIKIPSIARARAEILRNELKMRAFGNQSTIPDGSFTISAPGAEPHVSLGFPSGTQPGTASGMQAAPSLIAPSLGTQPYPQSGAAPGMQADSSRTASSPGTQAYPQSGAAPGVQAAPSLIAPSLGTQPYPQSGAAPGMQADSSRTASSPGTQAYPQPGITPGMQGQAAPRMRAYSLTSKEIMLAGLANGRTLLYIVIGLGLLWQLVSNLGLEDYIFKHSESWVKRMIALGIPAIAVTVLGILILSWIASILAFAMKNYNFSITTHGDRIEITRGLMSRVGIQVNLKRIQTLQIKQGIISRIFGYASIDAKLAVSQIGQGQSSDPGHSPGSVTLHPFIKLDRINEYIAAFLPEYAVRPDVMETLPKAALRRSVIRYGRTTLLVLGVPVGILMGILSRFSDIFGQLILPVTVAFSLFFLLMLVTGWRAWVGRGISVLNDFVAVRKGAYGRTWIFVPRRKIQIAGAGQNPFQRHSKLATVSVSTAATGIAKTELIDVSELQAAAFFNLVQRRSGAMTGKSESAV